ncbi:hypothetical protein GQ607_000089 [Colletotrichum asianum]|uniref:Uncharacterized protein n=1 Tax=Colletotrichum asianum TaxID=702518 RepID=A0A8H3WVD0_9PEZI|nr:hypothetical protein GQ607_000089 [Colletotrichum asianum]
MERAIHGWLPCPYIISVIHHSHALHWRRPVCPGLSTQDLRWKHKPYLITRRGSANGATGYRSCKTGLRGKTDRPSLRLWTMSSDFGFRVSSAM